MSLASGARLGVYEVLALLGTGGMGEVYRARDTKLGREVAIKILPAAFTDDADRLARFEREARLLASLNHPHIGAIYGFEESDGMPALVLELIEGETLAERIAQKAGSALPVKDALTIARQISDALDAAHERGIIHRDLKPANIKITPEGVVKVLDFGLAKAVVTAATADDLSHSPTVTRLRQGDGEASSEPGVILGTAAYMSPEQARGKPVDKRTDIWAFGCVLYEMLTGRKAFPGETVSDRIAAILEREPNWTVLPSATPPSIQRLLQRCLHKDQKLRLRDIADARVELDEALGHSPFGGREAAFPSRASRWSLWPIAAATIVVTALGYFAWTSRGTDSDALRLTNPVQVAASVGIELLPSWSADGRLIAYQSDQTGNNDVWVAQVGGAAVNRTADFAGGDEAPRLSPDGRQIAFWSARDGGGMYLMPTLGGSPRKIAPARPDVAMAAAWSPDGTEVAAPILGQAAAGQPSRLDILNVGTGAIRRVPLRVGTGSPVGGPGPASCLDLAWSPDGRFIACVAANSYNNQTSRLWTIRLSDSRFNSITDNTMIDWSPGWSPDGRSLFFTSNRGGTMDLWRQPITDTGERLGAPERLTTGLDVLQAAFTRDGKRVAYAKGRRVANVWRVPILPDRLATWSEAKQVTLDQAYIEAFDLSPDGQRLAVQSDRSGYFDIWTLPSLGGEMQQMTADPTPDWWPAWSPDGREIVFYSNRGSGNREAWVLPVAGGEARQLTKGGGIFPKWSRDGKSVFFGSGGISVVPAAGGEPKLLMRRPFPGVATAQWSSPCRRTAIHSRSRLACRPIGASGERQSRDKVAKRR